MIEKLNRTRMHSSRMRSTCFGSDVGVGGGGMGEGGGVGMGEGVMWEWGSPKGHNRRPLSIIRP